MSEDRRPVQLALVWHFHQPDYACIGDGAPLLPWTRLHALKDYADMVDLLERHDGIRATINVVPSLLEQLQAYADGTARPDPFLEVARRPAAGLTPEQRRFIVTYFLAFRRDTLARTLPRVHELAILRGEHGADGVPQQVVDRFEEVQLRDLQVLFHLAWCGPLLRERPEVRALFGKGREFTEEDKTALLDLQDSFLREILGRWTSLAGGGRVEFCVSPAFHPILPLLCDLKSAHEALPTLRLPDREFRHPEDARIQLEEGMRAFENVFGHRPAGGWSPEGAISEASLKIMAETGYRWTAGDEDVLLASLGERPSADSRAWQARRAKRINRPWKFNDGPVVLFRDHELSDRIGFVYSSWNPALAADDLLRRIHRIRRSLPEREQPFTVSIILDGENAWESYDDNGRPFLEALYTLLQEDDRVRTVTASEAADEAAARELPHVTAGSWIAKSLATWIGHEEKNRAWELLSDTRDEIRKARGEPNLEDPAWRALMAAEGSDWFYWLGDDNPNPFTAEFDRCFRGKLRAARKACRLEPEPALDEPIRRERDSFELRPTAPIHPTVDGRLTDYFEWLHAARVKAVEGVMPSASHLVMEMFFGTDGESLFLRLDPDDPPASRSLGEGVLRLNFPGFQDMDLAVPIPGEGISDVGDIRLAVDRVVEVRIPLSRLPLEPDLRFQVVVESGAGVKQRIPPGGTLPLEVPDGEGPDELDWFV